jgi:hypothetical protein
MKPEQLEIVRLKREVAKLKAERDFTGSGTDGTLRFAAVPLQRVIRLFGGGLAPRLLRRDRAHGLFRFGRRHQSPALL